MSFSIKIVTLLLIASNATAFSPVRFGTQKVRNDVKVFSEQTDYFMKESSAVNDVEGDIYSKVGFQKSNIGIGVDAEDVLKWLGTRDELIAKFMKDNKSFTEEMAATEVDRFMMDTEMVDKYIAFEKRKAENMAKGADYFRESREENLSDPSTLGVYALWIGGGVGFAYFKNVIAAPKYASGEWQDIHIQLPTPFWINEDAVPIEAVSSSTDTTVTLDAAQEVVDVVSDVSSAAVDAISDVAPAVQSVVDSATSAM